MEPLPYIFPFSIKKKSREIGSSNFYVAELLTSPLEIGKTFRTVQIAPEVVPRVRRVARFVRSKKRRVEDSTLLIFMLRSESLHRRAAVPLPLDKGGFGGLCDVVEDALEKYCNFCTGSFVASCEEFTLAVDKSCLDKCLYCFLCIICYIVVVSK